MQTTLHPLGICTLSDRVIGSVVQRTLPYHQRFLNESVDPHDNRQHPSLYSPEPLCSTRKNLDEVDGHSSTFMGPCDQKSSPRLRVSKRSHFPGHQRQKEVGGYATTVERRREYYRTKQQRYRERQRKREVLLEKKLSSYNKKRLYSGSTVIDSHSKCLEV
ncbi:hypothetical protein PHYPSEUDO_009163 [Phytophthora pseudosyringae]|uniref:Uncharacterized protein n=1 Tax=Phytophthora pseudosyringae TaxID=221518 RepID=A0A8T1VCL9_9STRA|nr:hypothetical protein PHYPSEUDO_009163 [Phytophthora pseudosyringae]